MIASFIGFTISQLQCADIKTLYQHGTNSCCDGSVVPDATGLLKCDDPYTPAQKRCRALLGNTLAAEYEGVITSVNGDNADVCEVRGYIQDRMQPFQVLIPYAFNGSYYHTAQAGFRGDLPDLDIDDNSFVSDHIATSKAAQGFPGSPEVFLNNPYLAQRFASKKSEIQAVKLIKRMIEKVTEKAIVISTAGGCSGGGETLLVTLWDGDSCNGGDLFDGVIVVDPGGPFLDWLDHHTLVNMENERISTPTWNKNRWFTNAYCDAHDGLIDSKAHASCDYHPSKFNCNVINATDFCFSQSELDSLLPLYDTLSDITVRASTLMNIGSKAYPWPWLDVSLRGIMSDNLMVNDLYLPDTTHFAAREKIKLSFPYIQAKTPEINYKRGGVSKCVNPKVLMVIDAHDNLAQSAIPKAAFDGLGQTNANKVLFDSPGTGHCHVGVSSFDLNTELTNWINTGVKPTTLTDGQSTICQFGMRWDGAQCAAIGQVPDTFRITTQPASSSLCVTPPADRASTPQCIAYKNMGYCSFTGDNCLTTCNINVDFCSAIY